MFDNGSHPFPNDYRLMFYRFILLKNVTFWNNVIVCTRLGPIFFDNTRIATLFDNLLVSEKFTSLRERRFVSLLMLFASSWEKLCWPQRFHWFGTWALCGICDHFDSWASDGNLCKEAVEIYPECGPFFCNTKKQCFLIRIVGAFVFEARETSNRLKWEWSSRVPFSSLITFTLRLEQCILVEQPHVICL